MKSAPDLVDKSKIFPKPLGGLGILVGWALSVAFDKKYGPSLGFEHHHLIIVVVGIGLSAWLSIGLVNKLDLAIWRVVLAAQRKSLFGSLIAVYIVIGFLAGYYGFGETAWSMLIGGLINGVFGYWRVTNAVALHTHVAE